MKAKKIDIQNFKDDFAKNHKAPHGSKAIPAPNVYMTYKVLNDLVPGSAKGICDLSVIKDYPELWMVLTLKFYRSHLQGDELKIFADYIIFIVKEDGDTSQVCQVYDKDVSLNHQQRVEST